MKQRRQVTAEPEAWSFRWNYTNNVREALFGTTKMMISTVPPPHPQRVSEGDENCVSEISTEVRRRRWHGERSSIKRKQVKWATRQWS